ncbi:MAG: putative Ig domain-containing protein, partial [Acidobacteriota bacterium]
TNVTISASNGVGTVSAVLVITIAAAAPDTTPPTVSLTSPVDGAAVGAGWSVYVTGTATDNVGVSQLNYLMDGSTYTFIYPPNLPGAVTIYPPNGFHTFQAIAFDAAGNKATSASARITVGSASVLPVITSALTAPGMVGTVFSSYLIVASNSLANGFNAVNLPPGFSINTYNGVISGTPTTAGTTNVTISASNGVGTVSAVLVINISPVNPPPAPAITSLTSVTAQVGVPFSYTIVASNNPTYSASNFPSWMSFDAGTHILSGTPTAAGTQTATISATNAGGSDSKTLTVTISPAVNAAQFISQSVPATMIAGQSYAVSVTLQNTGSAAWSPGANYRLGSQNPQDNTTWGTGRVYLTTGESIALGQQKTFSFNVIAPAAAGSYNFQWRMVLESVAWFGDSSTNVAVNVSAAAPVITSPTSVPAQVGVP